MSDSGRNEQFHGGRSMLNNPGYHSTAAMVAEIEDSSTWKIPENNADDYMYWSRPTSTLTVSDCTRSITMDFDWDSQRDRDNSLHKIDVMINLLTRFREGMAIEQERYVARRPKAKPSVDLEI